MASQTIPIQILRRELKDSMGDRAKLSKLHSVITESVAYQNAAGSKRRVELSSVSCVVT